MHNTQTDYAMQLARYDAAMTLFNERSGRLVYPDDVESPEWDAVFDADEAIREECHLFTVGELLLESGERLISWQLATMRTYCKGNPEGLNGITYLESNAWRPAVRKQLLGLAMRLDAPAIAAS